MKVMKDMKKSKTLTEITSCSHELHVLYGQLLYWKAEEVPPVTSPILFMR